MQFVDRRGFRGHAANLCENIAMKTTILLFATLFVSGCVSLPPISKEASDQLKSVGIGYGVVVGMSPTDIPEVRKMCSDGRAVESFRIYCTNLEDYEVVTVNVAATSAKSFFKNILVIPKAARVSEGDIIKFRFEDKGGFLEIASHGERQDCKWTGSARWTMGYPGMQGGIECDGWSYKSILHINWLNR